MRRIRVERAISARGFSRYITPVMTNYKLGCCDCGLVHEVEFRAIKVIKRYASGRFIYEHLPRTKYRVEFRVRRSERYTLVERRKMRGK